MTRARPGTRRDAPARRGSMVERLHATYAAWGAIALVLALVSRRIREWPVSEPVVALGAGVLLGPVVFDVIHVEDRIRDVLLLEGSRLLLAGSVMAAALRFQVTELRALLRALALLILVVMPLAAVITGSLALLLGLPLALAALLGACLSPTDPVLASSVVTGEPAERDLPARVRQLLTGESGANDGLALPLVVLALAWALPGDSPADVVGRLIWEVVGGTAIGVLLGLAAAWALKKATADRDLEGGPELVYTLLLAVAVLGVARLASTDGILAVFVAGLAYNRLMGSQELERQDAIDEAVNRYAVLPLFLLLGAVLPWEHWLDLGPVALVFVAGALLLRRPPLVLVLRRPLGLARRDAVFTGWFGPIGVSAIFYLAHSMEKGITDPRFFAAGTLAVVASVVAFALTASPGRKRYAAHARHADEAVSSPST